MDLVIIESPYAGDVERHTRYVRAAMADCIARGEAPYASHALYTQPGVLRDDIDTERSLGIAAGFEWASVAAFRAVYTDCGISRGMRAGIDHARAIGQPVHYRKIEGWTP